jgi:hypothetical protein
MPTSVDRVWITSELIKGLVAGRILAVEAKSRASSPPDPSLAVMIYSELGKAEDRFHSILEIIATRYGHTPTPSVAAAANPSVG